MLGPLSFANEIAREPSQNAISARGHLIIIKPEMTVRRLRTRLGSDCVFERDGNIVQHYWRYAG